MRKICSLLFLVVLVIGAARAETVYTLTMGSVSWDPSLDGATFTLTTDGPIISNASFFSPDARLTCSACTEIDMYPDATAEGWTLSPSQGIAYTPTLGGWSHIAFYFSPSSFTTDGTFYSLSGMGSPATLTVSGDTSVVTPEPSSFLLLGSGLLGLAGLLKRKLTA